MDYIYIIYIYIIYYIILYGAEVCELIGLCIISTINESINFESIGIYRDDGPAVFKSATGSESERQLLRYNSEPNNGVLQAISKT